MGIRTKFIELIAKRMVSACFSLSILLASLFFLDGNQIYSQTSSTIKGVVTDYQTGELLSFVSVSIKNRSVGAETNLSGKFEFKVHLKPGDSLRISYVGYATQTIPLSNKTVQAFNIQLKEETYHLGEVVVTADPNPGRTLMQKVIKQNVLNNLANLNRFHARRWEIKEVDVYDPKASDDKISGGIIFGDKSRVFASVRKDYDTLKKHTPLFFAEKISDYEITKEPFSESEQQIAVKTTGFETDKLLEPLVKWNAGDINLYSDWVLLFNKTFVSPVGRDAFSYYNFYILDSVALPKGHYNITFQAIPKDWRDNVFSGYFTVNDSSFALVSADLRLSKSANINFVEAIRIQQKYSPALDVSTGTHRYALSESILSLQYLANLESLGIPLPISFGDKVLICTMKVKNSAVVLNSPEEAEFAKAGALITNRRLMDTGHDDNYWSSIRPDTLTGRESSIYQMADHLKTDIKAIAKEKLLSTAVSGVYYIGDKIYIGPLGSLVSYNRIEGFRFRLSVRTMEGIFPKTGIYGHLAYGLKDQKFKSNIGVRQIWQTQPYSRSQIAYTSDYDVVIEWYDQSDKDNFVNSILRKRGVLYSKVYNKQFLVTHDQQIGANFLLHFGMNYQTLDYETTDPSIQFLYPNPLFKSNDLTPDEPVNKHIVPLTEFTVGLRFAWHESAKISNYTRLPLFTKYPVFILSYTHGVKFNDYDFTYQKWSLNINHTSHLTPKIEYIWGLEFGKIFGTIPSLILHQPQGSDSWKMSNRAFNLMTPYEFASDRYGELHSRINFGGLLFDRIPLLQKFQFRELIHFNSFWGGLSERNREFNAAQNITVADQKPYLELGIGIDNIFHLFSINYIRRINYLDSPGAKGNRNGIFLGFRVIY
jgi:hypothetical protein